MAKEILIVKKDRGSDRMKFKICDKETNKWSPSRYEKIIANKDYSLLAYLLYDLHNMGYPMEKAIAKFQEFIHKPELFFLE